MKKIFAAILLVSLFCVPSFAGKDDMDLVKKGMQLYQAGQYQESIDILEQALYINPDNFYAAQYSGMAYLKLGDQESALLQFERAYYVNPSPKTKKYIDQLKNKVRGAGVFMLYPVTFEASAALNMGTFYGNSAGYGYYSGGGGYSIGLEIFVSYHIIEWFCLTAGLMYDEKNGNLEGYDYSDPSYSYRGYYLDIPLMADFRVKTPWSDNAEVSFMIGGYIGLISSAAFTPDYYSDPPIDSDGISRTETGFVFGTGAFYYFGKAAVSFKEIMLVGSSNVHNSYDAKTMVFLTSFGVAF